MTGSQSSKGETKRGLNLPRCRNFQGLGLGTSVTKITNHFHLRLRSHCHFSKEGEEEGEGLKLGRGDWGGGGEQVRRWRRLKSSEVGHFQVFWMVGVSSNGCLGSPFRVCLFISSSLAIWHRWFTIHKEKLSCKKISVSLSFGEEEKDWSLALCRHYWELRPKRW